MLDVVLLSAMQVDGFLMDGGGGAREVDFADDKRLFGDVDDDEVIAGDRAEADGVGGGGVVCPGVIFAGGVEVGGLRETCAGGLAGGGAKIFACAGGWLER